MATSNPFKGIALDHEKVPDALNSLGVTDVNANVVNDTLTQYVGKLDSQGFMLKVFKTKDGKCTLGMGTGNDPKVFEAVASHVAKACRYADAARLEVSVPKFKAENVGHLVNYLSGLSAKVEGDEKEAHGRAIRIRGPRGDLLVVKYFNNGTLQLQGVHAQMAGWALEFLRTVLPLDEMLEQQRAVYHLPVTVKQIKTELAARIPHAHDLLVDEVRAQLSTALALTKVGIELEDYATLAFPALRGLEGFCIQLLRNECGLKPGQKAEIGLYFEKTAAGFSLAKVYSAGVAAAQQDVVGECYTAWNQHRHRLFHMDGTLETTYVLEQREDAVRLVNDVLDLVDRSQQRLSK